MIPDAQLIEANSVSNETATLKGFQGLVSGGDLTLYVTGTEVIDSIMRHVKKEPPATTDDCHRYQYQAAGQPALFFNSEKQQKCKPGSGKYQPCRQLGYQDQADTEAQKHDGGKLCSAQVNQDKRGKQHGCGEDCTAVIVQV